MTLSSLFRVPLAVLVFVVSLFGTALAAELKITEMTVTTKVVKGNPIDSVRRISSTSVKALYCFTRMLAPEGTDTTITHIWYLNDQPVGEYVLPVKGGRWRTYSKKALEEGMSGDWRCDALDSDGNLLKSVTFKMN